MYPTRYQLPELTAHVVAILERRREGFTEWNAEAEAKLTAAAKEALAEAGKQFAEVADDRGYWQRVEQGVLTVALPHYFKLAKEELQLEKEKYGLWRGGDLLSRVAYGAAGLVAAVIVWRTAIPDYLEPLPLAFFVGGPMLPDLQSWFARRRYSKKLAELVEDMREEAKARDHYRPMLEGIDPQATGEAGSQQQQTKTKEGSH